MLLRSIKILLAIAVCSSYSIAAELEIIVEDQNKQFLENAVIALHTVNQSVSTVENATSPIAIMDQKNKAYDPYVLAIKVGTNVSFPNSDDTRHHVYSFSKPKPFQLPLYQGKSAAPVLFDKPGVVVLGCNIHDSMLAYIYITDSPYFGKTDSKGTMRLKDIPTGEYVVKAWHPKTVDKNKSIQLDTITLSENSVTKTSVVLPTSSKGNKEKELTPLEKKFKNLRK